MKNYLWLLSLPILLSTFQVQAKIVLPMPTDPACLPAPTPTPTPTPTPPTPPTPPNPNPPVPPTPNPPQPPKPPRPPNPTPILPLPDYGPEPATTGIPLLDDALKGTESKALLPLWHNYPWRKITHPITWTAAVVDTIRRDGQGLVQTVPQDIYWYCPKYPVFTEDQRIAFWARFVSILAEEESSFNPLAVYYEDTMSTVKDPIFSIGMLQLSIESSQQKRFGCSMIQVQNDLFDWNKNLSCGIRIISAMVKDDQSISVDLRSAANPAWVGISHDWGTLRDHRMRSDVGRQCLGEMVDQRRASWIAEAKTGKNPALRDSEYSDAGEKYYERFMRFVNEFPLCN